MIAIASRPVDAKAFVMPSDHSRRFGEYLRSAGTSRQAASSAFSMPITRRRPSARSAAVNAGSLVGCFGLRIRRTSFSSLLMRRPSSDFVIPTSRKASSTASFAATSGATETGRGCGHAPWDVAMVGRVPDRSTGRDRVPPLPLHVRRPHRLPV
jgi:hypothetical protein